MKPGGMISAGVLLLLLGIVTPTYAQRDQHQEAKPPKQEQKGKHEKQQADVKPQPRDKNVRQRQNAQQQQWNQNNQREQRVQRQQQDQSKRQQQRAGQLDQNKQQEHAQHPAPNKQPQQRHDYRASQQGQRVQQGQHREVWQQHRARNWQSEHRDWRQRGGYSGYRIPENHYRGNFGANHWFRITDTQWKYMAGIRDSGTPAFGSVSWTRGQSTGRTIGTTTMTSMSFTPKTAITCTTAGTQGIGSQSPYMWTEGSLRTPVIEPLAQGRLGEDGLTIGMNVTETDALTTLHCIGEKQ